MDSNSLAIKSHSKRDIIQRNICFSTAKRQASAASQVSILRFSSPPISSNFLRPLLLTEPLLIWCFLWNAILWLPSIFFFNFTMSHFLLEIVNQSSTQSQSILLNGSAIEKSYIHSKPVLLSYIQSPVPATNSKSKSVRLNTTTPLWKPAGWVLNRSAMKQY